MSLNQGAEEKTGVSRRILLLNGIVVLLCVILFAQVVTFVKEAASYQKVYAVDEANLIRMITGQQYDNLVESVYRNESQGVPIKGDMAQIYATAYYYEAAMLYNAHQKAGNVQQAEEKFARMQAYEEQMEEYAFAKEEIWAILGIDPENLK
ncbi:MAG: hypothetical protein OSJ59_12660 [Lachnospiraceae bacterium]|nr:hypothetical protein [Lachnospiraceae bacterium]